MVYCATIGCFIQMPKCITVLEKLKKKKKVKNILFLFCEFVVEIIRMSVMILGFVFYSNE